MIQDWNAVPAAGAGLGAIFLFGLASSIHCLAMCGGFFLARGPRGNGRGHAAAYNLGRLLSYAAAGAIAGAAGSLFSVSAALRGTAALVGGLLVAAIGLSSLGAIKLRLGLLDSFQRRTASRIVVGRASGEGGSLFGFASGLLTVLMPCAPLQAMLLAAMGTGSSSAGTAVMLAFAAGTLPALAAGGALATRLSGLPRAAGIVRRASGAIVLSLGLLMVGRGLAVSGLYSRIKAALSFDAHLAASLPADASVASVAGGAQSVETRIESMAFHPIVVRRGLPVDWRIDASPSELNEHSSTVSIPDLGVERRLEAGSNEIVFTAPESTGEIDYCSWCGMIRSKIYVVEDTAPFAAAASSRAASARASARIPERKGKEASE